MFDALKLAAASGAPFTSQVMCDVLPCNEPTVANSAVSPTDGPLAQHGTAAAEGRAGREKLCWADLGCQATEACQKLVQKATLLAASQRLASFFVLLLSLLFVFFVRVVSTPPSMQCKVRSQIPVCLVRFVCFVCFVPVGRFKWFE